jgi:hypothetical protein
MLPKKSTDNPKKDLVVNREETAETFSKEFIKMATDNGWSAMRQYLQKKGLKDGIELLDDLMILLTMPPKEEMTEGCNIVVSDTLASISHHVLQVGGHFKSSIEIV